MDFFTYPSTTKYTLSECLLKAEFLDFNENFRVTALGMVTPLKRYFYSPEETVIRHRLMMENPADARGHSFFFLIETAEGRRGFLIEEQTEFSTSRASSFVNEIPGSKPWIPVNLLPSGSWLRSLTNLF